MHAVVFRKLSITLVKKPGGQKLKVGKPFVRRHSSKTATPNAIVNSTLNLLVADSDQLNGRRPSCPYDKWEGELGNQKRLQSSNQIRLLIRLLTQPD